MLRDKKDLSKKLAVTLLIIILVLSELAIYSHALHKSGYHIDELLSFGHSNSSNGGFLFPVKISGLVYDENNVLYNNWIEPDIFWNYLTVQADEVFRYSEISNNLSDSVHPPLYYFFLHTICSFFPETFSKWLGIIPNMILFSFVLIALYDLSLLLLKSRAKSLLVCAVFGFSIEAVNMTIFIRSYLLLTLITLLLVLETIRLLFDLKPKTTRLISIFLLSILGLLTHYYFYVFLVIITTMVSFYLWVTKQKKTLFSFLGIILLTITLSFLISPNILTHLFASTRGLEAGIRALLGLVALSCLTGVSLLIYRIIRKRNKELPAIRDVIVKVKHDLQAKFVNSSQKEMLFIILFLTVILTAVVIKLIAPSMDVHSDRYYFNLVPLICLIGIMLLFLLMNKYRPSSKAPAIISAVLLIFSISSNLFLKSAYVFPPNENRASLNSEIQDSICLWITDSDGKIHNFFDVFLASNKVFAARGISDPSIKKAFSELDAAQKTTIVIDDSIPQTSKELIILENQIGQPLQFLYKARHGTYLYRVYSVKGN